MLRKGILGSGSGAGARRTRIANSHSTIKNAIKSSNGSLSTTKRQLYDSKNIFMVNHNVPFITHPIVNRPRPLIPSPSENEFIKPVLPEPFKGLETKLNFKGDTTHRKNRDVAIHPSLLNQLKKFSDSHAKLVILLTYFESNRLLNPQIISDFLEKQFNVNSSSQAYDKLSDDLLLRLAKVYTMLKDDEKICEVYQYVFANKSTNQKLIKGLNNTVFQLLKEDFDLHLTFIDILKNIYVDSGIDIKALKDFYMLMNSDSTLKTHILQKISFLDILKTVQLATVIEKTENVLVFPKPYWETKFDYINVLLVIKLLKQNEVKLAFEHIERTNLYNVEGLYHRLLKNSKHLTSSARKLFTNSKQLTPMEIEMIKFTKTSNLEFSKPLINDWALYTKNLAFFYETTTILKNRGCSTLSSFKAEYFNQMVLQGSYKTAWVYLERNYAKYGDEFVHEFSIPIIVRLVLRTTDKKKYRNLVSKIFSPTQKEQFIENAIIKVLQNPYTEIESIPKMVHWLLEGYDYNIGVQAFLKLTPLFKDHLSAEESVELLKKLKKDHIPVYSTLKFFKFLDINKSIEVFSRLLLDDVFSMSPAIINFISHEYNNEGQFQLLSKLQPYKHYSKIHSLITRGLLDQNQHTVVERLLRELPSRESEILYEDYQILKHPEYAKDCEVDSSIESVRLTVFKRLASLESVSFNSSFQRQLDLLIRSKDVDKKMLSLLLLKNVATDIRRKSSDNQLFATKRLEWAIGLCGTHNVEKNLIMEAIGDYSAPSN